MRQEAKRGGVSLPKVQQTGLGPWSQQFSGPTTQIQGSLRGVNSVKLPQQQYSVSPSSAQHFTVIPSSGQQFPWMPAGGQQVSSLSSAEQQSGRLSSDGQHINSLPLRAQQSSEPAPRDQPFGRLSSGAQYSSGYSSSGQQLTGPTSSGQQFSGQQTNFSSVQLRPVGTDTSNQQRQMSDHTLPSQVRQPMDRPMEFPVRNEEDWRERAGNEFFPSTRNEGTMMSPQLPKLSSFPQRWNSQVILIPAIFLHAHVRMHLLLTFLVVPFSSSS